MRFCLRAAVAVLLVFSVLSPGFGSAYNARPRLVVIVVIDQFRGDYLERYRDRFTSGGFRLFLDRGAYFTDCNYNYANTRTAPGHATLLTGVYTSGHGIISNGWWDAQKKRQVSSVQDDATKLVGIAPTSPGVSPHNLLSDTLGDELKLATQGKSRVFGISLKDRAAVLPTGFAGDGAYWIDPKTGVWVTSTYYRDQLPAWVENFNESKRTEKYLNREWKDDTGKVLRTTKPENEKTSFYDLVGATPFANDYELEFARELIVYEKLGSGTATDLLVVSLSANDILGHKVGPDSPEMQAMALALDHQLEDFFSFLGHQIGLANVWMALSADHGVSPAPPAAAKLRIPALNFSAEAWQAQLNRALSARLSPGHPASYIADSDYPLVWLNEESFAALHVKEEEAERSVGEMMKQLGLRGYYTRFQLSRGEFPNTPMGMKYSNSYSPHGGWYVIGVPPPFTVGVERGTDHGTPYTYDTHVPLAFYGLAFQTGTYHTAVEPVDLATTLASLLGINAPTHAVGRVLTEALAPVKHGESSERPPEMKSPPLHPSDRITPAAFIAQESAQ